MDDFDAKAWIARKCDLVKQVFECEDERVFGKFRKLFWQGEFICCLDRRHRIKVDEAINEISATPGMRWRERVTDQHSNDPI